MNRAHAAAGRNTRNAAVKTHSPDLAKNGDAGLPVLGLTITQILACFAGFCAEMGKTQYCGNNVIF